MKKILIALLLIAAGTANVCAQETEQIEGHIEMLLEKKEKLDSLYSYWNDFVAQHPKDEKAWRNLFEVENGLVERLHFKDWNKGEELRKELNVVGRMKQAIPDTYTFYYCAYEGAYREEGWSSEEFFEHYEKFADLAVDHLPHDAVASDYQKWAGYLIPKQDTARLTRVLTEYYERGLYPAEELQYHFNELQGFFFRQLGGDEMLAADYTHDVFLRMYEARNRYLEDSNVATWLFSIAYNLCKNTYRHNEHVTDYLSTLDVEPVSDEEVEVKMDKERLNEALYSVLQSLPPPLRLLFSLRYEEELTIPQIAQIEHLPEGTVKSRLHKTMTIIRKKLQQYDNP